MVATILRSFVMFVISFVMFVVVVVVMMVVVVVDPQLHLHNLQMLPRVCQRICQPIIRVTLGRLLLLTVTRARQWR
jgi:hypothetical protein